MKKKQQAPAVARQFADIEGLIEYVEKSPSVQLLLDDTYQFVGRSEGALRSMKLLMEQGCADELRARAVELAKRTSADFRNERFTLETPAGPVIYEIAIRRLAHGFVGTYRDITSEVRSAGLVGDLHASGRSLAQLGAGLAEATGAATEQTSRAADGAGQMSTAISEIADGATQAENAARSVAESSSRAAAVMTQLQQATGEISAVVKLIGAIADQTKLLALNAHIEAARAGETGKGFAVVAGEVKDLAGRTAESTGQVTQIIAAVLEQTQEAALAIQEIDHLMGDVVQQQTLIAAAVEEQSAIAREMADSIAQVATTVTRTQEASQTVREVAQTMDQHAAELASVTAQAGR